MTSTSEKPDRRMATGTGGAVVWSWPRHATSTPPWARPGCPPPLGGVLAPKPSSMRDEAQDREVPLNAISGGARSASRSRDSRVYARSPRNSRDRPRPGGGCSGSAAQAATGITRRRRGHLRPSWNESPERRAETVGGALLDATNSVRSATRSQPHSGSGSASRCGGRFGRLRRRFCRGGRLDPDGDHVRNHHGHDDDRHQMDGIGEEEQARQEHWRSSAFSGLRRPSPPHPWRLLRSSGDRPRATRRYRPRRR